MRFLIFTICLLMFIAFYGYASLQPYLPSTSPLLSGSTSGSIGPATQVTKARHKETLNRAREAAILCDYKVAIAEYQAAMDEWPDSERDDSIEYCAAMYDLADIYKLSQQCQSGFSMLSDRIDHLRSRGYESPSEIYLCMSYLAQSSLEVWHIPPAEKRSYQVILNARGDGRLDHIARANAYITYGVICELYYHQPAINEACAQNAIDILRDDPRCTLEYANALLAKAELMSLRKNYAESLHLTRLAGDIASASDLPERSRMISLAYGMHLSILRKTNQFAKIREVKEQYAKLMLFRRYHPELYM